MEELQSAATNEAWQISEPTTFLCNGDVSFDMSKKRSVETDVTTKTDAEGATMGQDVDQKTKNGQNPEPGNGVHSASNSVGTGGGTGREGTT